ncbi:hypothetical protein QMK33_02190 [Hymenobacter sp. H14-R3]|uniref:hypothetical protein n=1 Tax=Hymenobacter sp. H14-R3 TaxID=3046308 RepID=UPI0024B896C4|nr:hypothetical protein [Hymenobacter sp. H14-R3]MDJ0363946.1 hypothetical protein [Hymenobacter sp. H14-R3]
MKKPAAGDLRWQRDGRTVYLFLQHTGAWLTLVYPALFVLVLVTDNPWSRILGSLLVGPGFGLNAIGLIRVVFWGLLSFMLLIELLLVMSREMLAIGQGTVVVRRQLLHWVFYYRRFEVRNIRKLEIREPGIASTKGDSAKSFDGGVICFHTATEAIAFGRNLAPAEARLALEELAQLGALPAALVAPALAAAQKPA